LESYYIFFDHRASAARLALAFRCADVSFAASALPPFNPPNLPSATAAGFLIVFLLSALR